VVFDESLKRPSNDGAEGAETLRQKNRDMGGLFVASISHYFLKEEFLWQT
jgi:hypothetical protein